MNPSGLPPCSLFGFRSSRKRTLRYPGNQSIEVAIIDYEKYLSGIRKGTRQVKQATARLLRVFRSASIRRLEEISADAIHEAVESFESEKGGEE